MRLPYVGRWLNTEYTEHAEKAHNYPPYPKKRSSSGLWLLFVLFVCFVVPSRLPLPCVPCILWFRLSYSMCSVRAMTSSCILGASLTK